MILIVFHISYILLTYEFSLCLSFNNIGAEVFEIIKLFIILLFIFINFDCMMIDKLLLFFWVDTNLSRRVVLFPCRWHLNNGALGLGGFLIQNI